MEETASGYKIWVQIYRLSGFGQRTRGGDAASLLGEWLKSYSLKKFQ
jgi:hypothetical protein